MNILLRRLNISPLIGYTKKIGIRQCSSNQGELFSGSNVTDAPEFDMENPFEKEKKQCVLCKHNITVDYKNVRLLSQFQSSYTGRIYSKHITGLCTKQQQIVEKEIVKAQNAGLMPFYNKEPTYLKDPQLYNVEKPIRPHRF